MNLTYKTIWDNKKSWEDADFPSTHKMVFDIFRIFIEDLGGRISCIKKNTRNWRISFWYRDLNVAYHILFRGHETVILMCGSTTLVQATSIYERNLFPSLKKHLFRRKKW